MSKANVDDELKTRFLADFSDEECDLKIITSDGALSIPYNFLESIADVVDIPMEGQGRGKKKMKLLRINEVTMVQLVKALTFYKPKHFRGITSKDLFTFLFFYRSLFPIKEYNVFQTLFYLY